MTAGKTRRLLVLGATGMLGNAVLRFFSHNPDFAVTGTTRASSPPARLPVAAGSMIECSVNAEDSDSLIHLFARAQPDIVINCIGLIKQLAEADNALTAIPINSLLPHRLARLSEAVGARLIHVSTDCVFSGRKGRYTERDAPDATDLYGRSKLLGEVDYPNAVTLRTSIIGHGLNGGPGLVDWFLAQEGKIKGYSHAIFSGLPTAELARVIQDYVIPHSELRGIHHVAASPISKLDLLRLVSDTYHKSIEIVPNSALVIDRSLDGQRFSAATGYTAPDWPALVQMMHNHR
jgi:dTDP-4-dehydrorhamnose reductase